MKKYVFLLLLLLTSIIFGCGQGGLVVGTVKTIVISPSTATMLFETEATFVATGYDSGGNEIYFNPNWFITPTSPSQFGVVTSTGRNDDDRPYCVFKPTGAGTGELHCMQSEAHGIATITSTVGAITRLTITPSRRTIGIDQIQLFTATAESGGQEITIFNPTWEVEGSSVTVESVIANKINIKGVSVGPATLEAHYLGLTATAEIFVSGTSGEASVDSDRDAYVDKDNSGSSYGTLNEMKVGGNKDQTGGTYEALVHFDLSSVSLPAGAVVTSVDIKLYVVDKSGTISARIFKVDGSWSESVTWSSKPSRASNLDVSGSVSVPSAGYYMTISLNSNGVNLVDDWINGSANYGFYIIKAYSSNGGVVNFSTREDTGKEPEIIIRYQY